MGEYELAIDAINAYIHLAPDEANPYDSRGEIYARHGQLDLAVESYRKALSIRPNYRPSWAALGDISLLQRKYDDARTWYQMAATDEVYSSRVMGRLYLAQIPLAQGKFSEALQILAEGIALDRSDNPDTVRHVDTGFKHNLMARIYLELGEDDRALQEFCTHMDIFREAYPTTVNFDRHQYIQLLAETGRSDLAGQFVEEYARDLSDQKYPLSYVEYARGSIEFARENYPAAIDHLSIAAHAFNDFPSDFMLGRAYLADGRLSEAVRVFEALLTHYSGLRAFWSIWSVKMHYYLGLADEQSHWYDKAAEQYSIFLETWEYADYQVPELTDAAQRLSLLHPKSASETLP